MGRKVHPIGFSLGIIKRLAVALVCRPQLYRAACMRTSRIRELIGKRLPNASLARIEIQRSANQIEVTLHTAKPGIVIGKGGQAVDVLRKDLETMTRQEGQAQHRRDQAA